jgi:hypothetical protein
VALCVLLLAARVWGIEVPGSGGRVAVGGYLDGLAVAETEGGPRQRPGALLDLHLEGEATRWLRGHLDLRTRAGGPFEGGHPGVYNLNHEYQNRSPSLEVSEVHADVHLRRADLRLGIQKVAWGKLDGIPPTDVVNPRDFHDPLVEDFEERKIGIPALLGTYYLPDVSRLELSGLRATLIYVPIAVPARLALAEERWFPSSTVPPSQVTVPRRKLGQFGQLFPHGLTIPVKFGTLNDRPPRHFDDGGIAFRLGGAWRESDWDVYHYTGPETGPNADLRVELRHPRGMLLPLTAVSRLRQAHDVIHMTGADWAMPIGGLTVRAEVAHFINKPYLRRSRDLISPRALSALPLTDIVRQVARRGRAPVPLGDLFLDLDTVEWGIGADTVWHGFIPLLQVSQIVLLEPAPRLLITDPETRFTALLRRRFLAERLELELRAVYTLDLGGWFAFPRVSYLLRDDLRLRLGYLAVGGPRSSLIGQFHDNDEVVFQARWSF